MLSKISGEEIIKGFINDYTKIKEEFKVTLKNEGFYWQNRWKRQNLFGMEGVWLNYISKLSIRIRWGVVNPSAIVYVEVEFLENIRKFFDNYETVMGMSSPNHDYDLLNKELNKSNHLKVYSIDDIKQDGRHGISI